MFGARQAVTKNTPFGKTAGEKMNKSEKKTIEKMVEKQPLQNQTYAKPMLMLFVYYVGLCFSYVMFTTAYVLTM